MSAAKHHPTEPDGAEIVGDVEYDSIRDRWQPTARKTDSGERQP